ncbi:probable glutamate receptor isoform X2 [Scylla paramamosain]
MRAIMLLPALHTFLAFLSLFGPTMKAASVPSNQELTAMMLVDYLEFFHHLRVCLLVSEEPEQLWVRQAVVRVARASHAFLTVLRLNEANSTRHHHGEGRRHLPCERDLLLAHLTSRSDVHLFGQVFASHAPDASWLLLVPAPQVTRRLANLYLPLHNRVTVAAYSPDVTSTSVSLLQCYHVSEGDTLRLQWFGAWHYDRTDIRNAFHDPWRKTRVEKNLDAPVLSRRVVYGVLESLEGDPVLRRNNLHGIHLRCSTISSPPRTILKPAKDGAVDVTGILGRAYEHMMQVANFTSTCFATKDGQWGGLRKDGTWTGMIGDIVSGRTDIALASLDITQERSKAVDFLMAVVRTEYLLIMKRPRNDDRKWSTFTSEFETRVWVVLAASLLAVTATLRLASLQNPQRPLPPSDALLVVVGGLCGQGTSEEFRTFASHLVFLTLLMLQVLVTAHYTSYLVSSMAVGPPLPTVSTIADISRHPRLRLNFIRGSSITEYFRTSRSQEHQEAWENMQEDDFVESREEGTARVLRGPYVFLEAGAYLNKRYGADCRYFILPTPNFPSLSAFAVRKGSPFIPILNNIILKMKSTGLMKKWHWEATPKPVDCSDLEFLPVEASVVVTAFLLLASGASLSLLFLAWERNRYGEKRESKIVPRRKDGKITHKGEM